MPKRKRSPSPSQLSQPVSGAGNTKQPLRVRARRWCFTWHIEPEDVSNRFLRFLETACVRAVYGHEKCPTTQRSHLQGYLECKNQVELNTLKELDSKIHWEKAMGSPEQNLAYCTKDGDFRKFGHWPTQVRDPLEGKELRDWQVELEEFLSAEPDPRKIRWYCDPVGNAGKSSWSKHWVLKHADSIVVDGAADNIKCALALLKKENKPMPRTIIWDIPRSQEHVSYTAMEKIKDGLFFSGKYESGMVIMETPHVVCFANRLPDHSKLSGDRWDIRELSALVFSSV